MSPYSLCRPKDGDTPVPDGTMAVVTGFYRDDSGTERAKVWLLVPGKRDKRWYPTREHFESRWVRVREKLCAPCPRP